jgi:hypothetical protein
MSFPLPSLDLTETAGRIREHLADQSQRPFLDEWVTDTAIASALQPSPTPPKLEDRLLAQEAQLEAVQENFRRLGDKLRGDLSSHQFLTRSEIQKLASQIRELAAHQTAHQSSAQLELKIGSWLSAWQHSVHQHLLDREKYYLAYFNDQFTRLWQTVESRLEQSERIQDSKPLSKNPTVPIVNDPFPIAP